MGNDNHARHLSALKFHGPEQLHSVQVHSPGQSYRSRRPSQMMWKFSMAPCFEGCAPSTPPCTNHSLHRVLILALLALIASSARDPGPVERVPWAALLVQLPCACAEDHGHADWPRRPAAVDRAVFLADAAVHKAAQRVQVKHVWILQHVRQP